MMFKLIQTLILVSFSARAGAKKSSSCRTQSSETATLASTSVSKCTLTPTYAFSTFSYAQITTNIYASPLPTPIVGYAPTYAPAFDQVSTLLSTNVTYTTYALRKSSTLGNDGQYGQSAYAALREGYAWIDSPPFTTTVSPTPVPTSELVKPPMLYNAPSDDPCMRLPDDFVWGVAGSAWQIEEGLQVEGRGPSSLDFLGILPNKAGLNDSNVADMHYFMYKQDIARLAAIGVPYYSFSISWGRIVPFGTAGSPVNTQAITHYDDVLNTCLEYGIKPIVTLSHIDPPIAVNFDEETLIADFTYYAKEVMTRYGDRVPYWVTFNEPNIGLGFIFKTWGALKHILYAHTAVYDWYKNELGGKGQISIKFANNLAVPLHQGNASNIAIALRYQNFVLGIMGNPLFLGKQFPQDVMDTLGANLTALRSDEINYFHGKIDFFSVDPYSSQFISPAPNGLEDCASNSSDPLWPYCATFSTRQANGWLMGARSNSYAYIEPQYVREQIGYLWNTFQPSGGVFIAEFGFNPIGDIAKPLDTQSYDLERTLYYQDYLQEILRCIYEDGVKIIGTLAWSFIDNNEFGAFANQYGMQTVNRTSGNFERTYKRSFFDFVDFFYEHIG